MFAINGSSAIAILEIALVEYKGLISVVWTSNDEADAIIVISWVFISFCSAPPRRLATILSFVSFLGTRFSLLDDVDSLKALVIVFPFTLNLPLDLALSIGIELHVVFTFIKMDICNIKEPKLLLVDLEQILDLLMVA